MSFLFHKRKSPDDAMRSLTKYLQLIDSGKSSEDDQLSQKTDDKLVENINAITWHMLGDSFISPSQVVSKYDQQQAAQEGSTVPQTPVAATDTSDKMAECLFDGLNLFILLTHVEQYAFDSRKAVCNMFIVLSRHYPQQTIAYFTRHQHLITFLIDGYDNPDVGLFLGQIIRELAKHPELCALILQPTMTLRNNIPDYELLKKLPHVFQNPTDTLLVPAQPIQNPNGKTSLPFPHIERLFGLVQFPVFDIASDAFSTLKQLLTRHKKVVSVFLDNAFDPFFQQYCTTLLLNCDNYVTKRLALNLLSEILLCRDNFNIMITFINVESYLKIIMSLLKNPKKTIQIGAFHVFKVFCANPHKAAGVAEILYKNRLALINFLRGFTNDRGGNDEQFADEKQILISTLETMEMPAGLRQKQ